MKPSFLPKISMAILMLMILIIPQSFFELKLPFLGVVLLWGLFGLLSSRLKIRSASFPTYYIIFFLLTAIWCLIGLVNGNSEIAIMEALRVYGVWMLVYFFLTIYVSNIEYQLGVDRLVITGALGIGAVATYTLLDGLFQLGWLPQSVMEDMYLQVGLNDGYTQLNNVNIGMLNFIGPYLLSRLLLLEKKEPKFFLIIGLIVAVFSVIIASRRAVMAVLLISPFIVVLILALVGQVKLWNLKIVFWCYLLSILIVIAGMSMINYFDLGMLDGFTTRVLDAFTAEPEGPRTLQHAALMAGFSDSYIFGSGFGGVTSDVRSYDRPWTFELTYSRLLFNGGVLGVGVLVIFYFTYFLLTIRKIKHSGCVSIHISLLTGFISVLIAAASNPYLSSFDFIFVLSIIPLILNTRDQTSERSVTQNVEH